MILATIAHEWPGATLPVSHGCEWITFDRDFAKFPGVKWRAPTISG